MKAPGIDVKYSENERKRKYAKITCSARIGPNKSRLFDEIVSSVAYNRKAMGCVDLQFAVFYFLLSDPRLTKTSDSIEA